MTFSISEALSKSWSILKPHWLPVAGVFLLVAAITGAASHMTVFALLVTGPVSMGWLRFLYRLRIGGALVFDELLWPFQTFERFIHSILLHLMIFFGTVIGLIALAIPGIWFGVAASFATYYFVTGETVNSVEAIKRSMRAIKGHWWGALGVLMVFLGLMILGGLLLGLGILLTAPLASLMVFEAAEAYEGRGLAISTPSPPPATAMQ